ncbi:MAG: hypothetical protein RL368_1669 [Pseudomonadota bacterium]
MSYVFNCVTPISKKGYRMQAFQTLTGLRFLAAFYVFAFHIHIRYPLNLPQFFTNILKFGAVGVTLFFMLSGFVLTVNYGRKAELDYYFYIRRFARIYPVYLFSLLSTLPIFLILPVGEQLQTLQFWLVLLLDIFLIQSYFYPVAMLWHGGASWSLSVEAFFYAIFPFFLKIVKRLSAFKLYVWIVIFTILSIIPGLIAIAFPSSSIVGHAYTNPFSRLPEFVVGMLFGMLYLQKQEPHPLTSKLQSKFDLVLEQAISLLQTAFILSLIILYLGSWASHPLLRGDYYVTHNFFLVPMFGILIYLLTKKSLLSMLLSSKIMVFLGEISYSFYLNQVVVIFGFKYWHDNILINKWSSDIILIVTFCLLLLLSIITYLFVEKPLRKMILNRQA